MSSPRRLLVNKNDVTLDRGVRRLITLMITLFPAIVNLFSKENETAYAESMLNN